MYASLYQSVRKRIATRRGITVLAAITLVTFVAQFPATSIMADHGASITDFEFAGTTQEIERILDGYGSAGKDAAWMQLAIDVPFLVGYGLLIAGCCLAAADGVAKRGRPRLAGLIERAAWCGPLAAACDMVQNVSLAFVLTGHTGQPTPRLSEVFGYATLALAGIGILTIAAGIAVLLVDRLNPQIASGASGGGE